MLVLTMPLFNNAIRIYLSLIPGMISYIVSGLSIFLFYGISLLILIGMRRILHLKNVEGKENIITIQGYVKVFVFYSVAVLFLSPWNSYFLSVIGINIPGSATPPSSNDIGIAIGTAALLLYYQYVVEYVSKFF
jgi:hypothetical protein